MTAKLIAKPRRWPAATGRSAFPQLSPPCATREAPRIRPTRRFRPNGATVSPRQPPSALRLSGFGWRKRGRDVPFLLFQWAIVGDTMLSAVAQAAGDGFTT